MPVFRSSPGPSLGMRRVSWVRIVVSGDGTTTCALAGVGHRLPISRPVPLGTALELAAAGVPLVLRVRGAGGLAPAAPFGA